LSPGQAGGDARLDRDRRGVLVDAATRDIVDDARLSSLLVAVGRARDRAAFAELFRHYAPRVKGYLMRTGLDPARAEDCMQDVMVTMWRRAHLYDPTRASASTWLYAVARNRKIDLVRRTRRPEPEELPWGPEAAPEAADVIALAQDTARLAAAVADLPDKQRELIERAFYGDLSHREIAVETGLPLGTIKSRIRLAIERLRYAMDVGGAGMAGPS
jgi:RNA polymerase sigma-70 factor (ECF subfamily)